MNKYPEGAKKAARQSISYGEVPLGRTVIWHGSRFRKVEPLRGMKENALGQYDRRSYIDPSTIVELVD